MGKMLSRHMAVQTTRGCARKCGVTGVSINVLPYL